MTEAPSKVLVLGAGGVGAWVAKSLKSRGHDVLATTTQVDTDRALTCLGVEVLSWRWSPGASWADLEAFGASHWVVTVPPRGGKEHVHAFHEALNASAQRAGVSLLVWTSSTAVYDPNQTGSIGEGDAGRHLSRHTGLSMLDIEDIHRHSAVPSWPCGLEGCLHLPDIRLGPWPNGHLFNMPTARCSGCTKKMPPTHACTW